MYTRARAVDTSANPCVSTRVLRELPLTRFVTRSEYLKALWPKEMISYSISFEIDIKINTREKRFCCEISKNFAIIFSYRFEDNYIGLSQTNSLGIFKHSNNIVRSFDILATRWSIQIII